MAGFDLPRTICAASEGTHPAERPVSATVRAGRTGWRIQRLAFSRRRSRPSAAAAPSATTPGRTPNPGSAACCTIRCTPTTVLCGRRSAPPPNAAPNRGETLVCSSDRPSRVLASRRSGCGEDPRRPCRRRGRARPARVGASRAASTGRPQRHRGLGTRSERPIVYAGQPRARRGRRPPGAWMEGVVAKSGLNLAGPRTGGGGEPGVQREAESARVAGTPRAAVDGTAPDGFGSPDGAS